MIIDCICDTLDPAGCLVHRPGCVAVGFVAPAPGTGPPDRLPRADPAIEVGGAVSVRGEFCRQHPTVAHGACVECLRQTREALRLCVEALALLGTGARVPVRVIKDALAAAKAVGVAPEDR